MTVSLQPHRDSPVLPVETLTADARRLADGRIEIVYRLVGDLDKLLIPELSDPMRADELWKHTCFEIFVLKADGPGYVEFNFAPTGRWAAYSFRTRRSGMQNIASVSEAPIGTLTMGRQFVLRAEVNVSGVEGVPQDEPWRVAISAVVEAADGKRAYWAVAHPEGNADFHAPEGYVVTLPAPDKQPTRFLSERRADDNSELVAGVLELANTIRIMPALWRIFERVKDTLDMTDEEMSALRSRYAVFYAHRKQAVPLAAAQSGAVLRMLAAGRVTSLDSKEVAAYLSKHCKFN